jgi:GT2 family glycosyltransferase
MSERSAPLAAFWSVLPEPLRHKLLLGFTGKLHLLDVAGWCLRSGDPGLTPVAVGAIQTAFGENPLDGAMASELVSRQAVRDALPGPTLEALVALSANWQCPENTGYYERLLVRRDFDKTLRFLAQAVDKEPENLFWREQGVALALVAGDVELAGRMAAFAPRPGLEGVATCVNARVKAFGGHLPDAARLFQGTDGIFGPAFGAKAAGLCMLGEGEPASATLLLLDAVRHAPWDTSLLLRVHDLLAGRERELCRLSGSTAILLYSWNKAIELDATLRSLLGSELGGASLFVLNNGSTDDTAQILESWRLRFDAHLGPGRFTSISLPVNVGAPAARNWLMHHEAVARHDFICYLDDDVELPGDWLLRLGAAVREYPGAGVWGCKVVDHANPALIQSADNHLTVDPDGPGLDLTRLAPNPFKLSDLHIQGLDCGLFDILRPCASVTGCCHLFRAAVLDKSGDFAIHLSPSQYDDMEHDLRLCEAGTFPVYQGHLALRHKKRSGAASRVSAQAEGNALGNKYKMQTMHDRAAILAAQAAERAVLEADLVRKLALVERAVLS